MTLKDFFLHGLLFSDSCSLKNIYASLANNLFCVDLATYKKYDEQQFGGWIRVHWYKALMSTRICNYWCRKMTICSWLSNEYDYLDVSLQFKKSSRCSVWNIFAIPIHSPIYIHFLIDEGVSNVSVLIYDILTYVLLRAWLNTFLKWSNIRIHHTVK